MLGPLVHLRLLVEVADAGAHRLEALLVGKRRCLPLRLVRVKIALERRHPSLLVRLLHRLETQRALSRAQFEFERTEVRGDRREQVHINRHLRLTPVLGRLVIVELAIVAQDEPTLVPRLELLLQPSARAIARQIEGPLVEPPLGKRGALAHLWPRHGRALRHVGLTGLRESRRGGVRRRHHGAHLRHDRGEQTRARLMVGELRDEELAKRALRYHALRRATVAQRRLGVEEGKRHACGLVAEVRVRRRARLHGRVAREREVPVMNGVERLRLLVEAARRASRRRD